MKNSELESAASKISLKGFRRENHIRNSLIKTDPGVYNRLMARSIESENCNAQVIISNTSAGAILSCRSMGEGKCLKDVRVEAGSYNVSLFEGACFADAKDGKKATRAASELICALRYNPGSLELNLILDQMLQQKDRKG